MPTPANDQAEHFRLNVDTEINDALLMGASADDLKVILKKFCEEDFTARISQLSIEDQT